MGQSIIYRYQLPQVANMNPLTGTMGMQRITVKLASGLGMPPLGFVRDGENWVLNLGAYVLHAPNSPPIVSGWYVSVHREGQTKGDTKISVDIFKTESEAISCWRNGFVVTEPKEGSNAAPWVKFLLSEGILERVSASEGSS